MLDAALPLAIAAVAAPLVAFFVLTALVWGRDRPAEAPVVNVSRLTFLVSLGASLALAVWSFTSDEVRVLHAGSWFEVAGHSFELTFVLDRLSTALMVLTSGACSLVGHFSRTYLHGERGLPRFFLLLNVFAFGMMILVSAGSVDFLFVGWEVVGLTSALLIGFFHERSTPVKNGLQAFLTYRAADVGLLVGTILLHHFAHASDFRSPLGAGHWAAGTAHLDPSHATLIALLFLVAAMGKSAQVPLGDWLPRAMEGPTPSSAIFYGALSVHAGVYLLLRAAPLFEDAPLASGAMIAVGATTAVVSTLSGRVQSDVKNVLAFATRTQVGLMFIEIGLQLYTLAAIHLVGHACLRTWQLLRSPSILQEMHGLRGALDSEFETGRFLDDLERRLPIRVGAFLYQRALDRFYFDALAVRFVIAPLFAFARTVARLDARYVAFTTLDEPPRTELTPEAAPREVRP